jgi:hypothetical protein
MNDAFGGDTPASEMATATPDTSGGSAAAPSAMPATTTPVTLAQAVDKATAKATADAVVAKDPHATHHAVLGATSPIVLGATAAGAGIGFWAGGPVGAAIGAAAGWTVERYQVLGGVLNKVKSIFVHKKA